MEDRAITAKMLIDNSFKSEPDPYRFYVASANGVIDARLRCGILNAQEQSEFAAKLNDFIEDYFKHKKRLKEAE